MAGMTSVSRTADSTDPAPELRQRWAVTVAEARGKKNPTTTDPAPYADNLLSRWREPQRRYHTVDHLAAVLYRIDELAEHADDLSTVQLAAWFHDAVYRPDRSENEERSAALAERALPELGIGAARTAEVARLVRLTVTHDPAPDDPDGEVLCDADLAVLAGSPDDVRRLRRRGPRRVRLRPRRRLPRRPLRRAPQLLSLPRLFRTPRGYDRWEHPARRNLATELDLLRAA